MDRVIKAILLKNNIVIVSEIIEVMADIGEPDCKLINPFVIRQDKTMEPFLCGYTKQNEFMMSSDKIITLADPTPTLLEKYEDLIKE